MSTAMAHVRKGRAVSPRPPRSYVSSGLFDPIGHWILGVGHWMLRFLQPVARRVEPGGFRSHRVNALAYSRSPSVLSTLGVLLLLCPAVRADEISLRNGSSLTGRVLMVQSGSYVFQDDAPRGTMQNIPKAAVRYALYDDPAQADRVLGIRSALRHAEGEASFVRLLPTRPFGQAILEAVQNAHASIWVSAYYISGSSTSPIKDFYTALAEKAQQGLDVVVVSEYGPGTSARVREATYNFARELEQSGIRVLFMSGYRILHKKMILVDSQIALLGSANLTMAGTLQSDEMNVEIRQPAFVARMHKDFEKIMASAQTAEASNSKENK